MFIAANFTTTNGGCPIAHGKLFTGYSLLFLKGVLYNQNNVTYGVTRHTKSSNKVTVLNNG